MKKLIVISIVFLVACTPTQVVTTSNVQNPATVIDGKLFATMFQQKAAEYRALCFQAYNIAKLRLDTYKPLTGKPKAIVTDIDETLFDNSPYQVQEILKGRDFNPASWAEWTSKGIADTLPGSASFLKYAASKGVTIFYITNRDSKDKDGTLKNLRLYDLPNADEAHYMQKQSTSSKEARRQSVTSTHEIMMLLGDNLSDFSALFDKKTVDERLRNTNYSVADFGNRFIVLPNPVYGDWESALYNYNRISLTQKDSILRSILKTN